MGIMRIPAFVVARNISPLVFLQTRVFGVAGLRHVLSSFNQIILAVITLANVGIFAPIGRGTSANPSCYVILEATHIGGFAEIS